MRKAQDSFLLSIKSELLADSILSRLFSVRVRCMRDNQVGKRCTDHIFNFRQSLEHTLVFID